MYIKRPSDPPTQQTRNAKNLLFSVYIPCALLYTIGSRFAKPLIFESIRAKLISTNWWWVDNAIAEDQATTANVLEVSLTQQLNIIYVYVHFSAKHIRTLIMSVRIYSFQLIRSSKCTIRKEFVEEVDSFSPRQTTQGVGKFRFSEKATKI